MSNKDYVPVEGHPNLVRDTKSGAVINIDRSAIQIAKEQKRLRRQKDSEARHLHERVLYLEQMVLELRLQIEELKGHK